MAISGDLFIFLFFFTIFSKTENLWRSNLFLKNIFGKLTRICHKNKIKSDLYLSLLKLFLLFLHLFIYFPPFFYCFYGFMQSKLSDCFPINLVIFLSKKIERILEFFLLI